jgi:hypothetical protein
MMKSKSLLVPFFIQLINYFLLTLHLHLFLTRNFHSGYKFIHVSQYTLLHKWGSAMVLNWYQKWF